MIMRFSALVDKLAEFIKPRKCTFIGLIISIAVATMLLSLGFWKTILVVSIIGIGIFIGRSYDKGSHPILDIMDFSTKVREIFRKLF